MVGGLWRASAPRAPPDVAGLVHDLDGGFWDSQAASSDQPQELTFVEMDTFLATLNHQFLLVQSVLWLRNKIPILRLSTPTLPTSQA